MACAILLHAIKKKSEMLMIKKILQFECENRSSGRMKIALEKACEELKVWGKLQNESSITTNGDGFPIFYGHIFHKSMLSQLVPISVCRTYFISP